MKYININGEKVKLTKSKIKEIIKLEKPLSYFSKYDNDELASVINYAIDTSGFDGTETISEKVDAIYDDFETEIENYLSFKNEMYQNNPEEFAAGGHIAVAAAVKDIAPGSVDAIDKRIAKKINPKERPPIVYYEDGGEVEPEDFTYRIVEGTDPKTGKPLFQVVGENNEYVGEWDADEKAIEKELNDLIKNKMDFKKGTKEIELPNSNLYLTGFGRDTNGNKTIKLNYANQKGFSIQTLGNLKYSDSNFNPKTKLHELTNEDVLKIEKEVVDYLEQFGSKKQKSSLKKFEEGGKVDVEELNNLKTQKTEKMENKYDFSKNITAKAGIKDLEDLGWNFDDIHESVANAQGITEEEASKYNDENYFVNIYVDENGSTLWNTQSYNGNESSDREESGDDAQTIKDLKKLNKEGKLWDIEKKEYFEKGGNIPSKKGYFKGALSFLNW